MIKQKAIVVLLILFFISFSYGEDNSTDKKNNDSSNIKFRGGIYLPMQWNFSYDPTKSDNHISLTSYSYDYDYTDKGDPDNKHHNKNDPGSEITPSYLSIKLLLGGYFSIIYPLLKFDHFLLNNNNINLTFSTYITPLSIAGSFDTSFTPIAFLSFDTGVQFGTGWNIDGIGAGLARDNSNGHIRGEKKEILMKDSFYGSVFITWISTSLQLDLSAIMDDSYKRWTHVVMSVAPDFEYIMLLNSSYYEEPFYWELDRKLKGWTFSCDFALGYKIPVIEDSRKKEAENKMFMGAVRHNNFSITAIMWASLNANLTHFNDSIMMNHGWGSDFIYCTFGPNIIFDLPNNLSFFIGFHWTNGMVYSNDTVGNNDIDKSHYHDWRIIFEKIAWSISWDF